MKRIVLLLAFLVFSFTGFGQEKKVPHQSVFAELGGSGLAYSFNYDFRFDSTRIDSWGMRIGAGGYAMEGDSFFFVTCFSQQTIRKWAPLLRNRARNDLFWL